MPDPKYGLFQLGGVEELRTAVSWDFGGYSAIYGPRRGERGRAAILSALMRTWGWNYLGLPPAEVKGLYQYINPTWRPEWTTKLKSSSGK